MKAFRIGIRVYCHCDEGGHDVEAFRSATPGLLVAPWAHAPGREGRWTVLHHVTGLVMPLDFGDPESAMACAHALAEDGEWVGTHPAFDSAAARVTLAAFGGECYGAVNGPREQLNEVPA